MTDVIQRSFAGGEIAPALWARADTTKYATGLRTCRNFMIRKHGGATNRPGTIFTIETKDSTKASIVVQFRYSNSETYAMEFGHLYIRFHRDAGTIMVTSSDAPAYSGATSYVVGDLCTNAGVRYYCKAPTTGNAPPNAAYWYPLTGDIYEIPTPYTESSLAGLRFTQSADVVSIVHESFDPMDLSRFGNVRWTLVATVFGPSIGAPTGGAAVNGTAGTTVWRYKVAAIDASTGEESEPSSMFSCTGGTPTSANPNTLSWNATAGAGNYEVYKEIVPGNGIYAIIGIAATNAFNDINITPNSAIQPVTNRTPFAGAGNKPSEVTYYQGRRVYAATVNDPELVSSSKSGAFTNMSVSTPLQDDDAVSFSLAGNSINRVTGLVGLRKLIVLTESGEWTAEGDVSGIITPGQINPVQQSYNGAARLPVLVVGNEVMYVQARNNIIRNLGYEFQTDGYKGDDVSLYASHLFEGRTVVGWAYSQVPDSIVWVVMSDGALLGLTYIKSQQMWGWHRHDTKNGLVESVCVVPEANEDVPYMIVKRTINGVVKRYVECLHTRYVADIKDCHFVDCGLWFDGTNLDLTNEMTLTGGVTWNNTETFVLTANTAAFAPTDIGNGVALYVGGVVLRLEIVSYTSTTVVGVTSVRNVPVAFRAVAIADWAFAVDVISGLDHLEGQVVSVLGDGHVVSNGVDAPLITVTGGSVNVGGLYVKLRIGLPIEADLETLSIDGPNQETLINKESLVKEVDLMVESSRGIWAGPDADNLTEYKQRNFENYDDQVSLVTDVISVGISGTYSKGGRVFIRQRDPLPLTVLAAIPVGDIGGR